jgi:hyaluronan synthase
LTIEIPRAELALHEDEDLFSHCKQRISKNGRIQVSRKAWAFRLIALSMMISITATNLYVALTLGDSLIIYSTLMPIHAIAVFIIGWFYFKNKATGDAPDDLVSVIIPVYNQEKLIREVIDAILRSTYTNLEIIAVDDGSKDNTGQILDSIAKEKSKVKVVHKPNGGKRTAVATGFYVSRGEYVILIDSDSIVDEYAIEQFMKTFSADPEVGGVVANGRVLNAEKNLLTKCQDVWYDYSFNIHKTTESTFGTVLCLSGCLAGYRREAISRFIPFWAEYEVQYGDDRNLTTYVVASPWAKEDLAPLSMHLMKSMARYDDSEDRGLTAQTLVNWKTVYVPTAVVHTEVPETLKKYLRQQTRWKKGYLRSTFFVSAFFWRKNPIIAALFYIEFMSALTSPFVIFSIYFYAPIFLGQFWFPLTYLAGQLLIGLVAGVDYKFRDPTARNWKHKPLMNLISSLMLTWILFPALYSFRKNGWLTR